MFRHWVTVLPLENSLKLFPPLLGLYVEKIFWEVRDRSGGYERHKPLPLLIFFCIWFSAIMPWNVDVLFSLYAACRKWYFQWIVGSGTSFSPLPNLLSFSFLVNLFVNPRSALWEREESFSLSPWQIWAILAGTSSFWVALKETIIPASFLPSSLMLEHSYTRKRPYPYPPDIPNKLKFYMARTKLRVPVW